MAAKQDKKPVAKSGLLPLRDKTFYIDEVDVTKVKLRRLERSLNTLGAKIEKFFTKDINYLITDHGQDTDYNKGRSRSCDGGTASTPSPFAYTPGSGIGTPPESTTAQSSTAKAPISRGSMMLSKTRGGRTRQSGSTSSVSASEKLVRNARQWSINMLRVNFAISWTETKIGVLGLNNKRNTSSDRADKAQKAREKVLKIPYVKLEDISGLYRPVYKQLTAADVPVLNLNATHCPFETVGNTAAVDMSEPQADKTLDSTKLDTSRNLSEKNNKGKSPMARGKSRAAQRKTSTNMRNNNNNNEAKKKKKLTFCMVCKVRYDDLEQHLRSDQHQEFANNADNYSAVDKLIDTNANMKRFLDDIMKYHTAHQREGLDLNSSDREALLVLDTPAVVQSPPDVVHRSVSDSSASESGDTQQNVKTEHEPVAATIAETVEVEEIVVSETAVQTENQQPSAQDVHVLVPDVPYTTMIEVKPRISNNISSVVKPSTSKKRQSKSPRNPTASPAKTISQQRQQNDDEKDIDVKPITYDLESDMSPSEIVKIRKRGKKNSLNSLKRIISPEKPSKSSPKRSPRKQVKSAAKAKSSPQIQSPSKQLKDKEVAEVKAHWNLLSSKPSDADIPDSHGLPLDVSYGTLDDDQMKTMAGQKTSFGTIDDDDMSFVQSIHGLLTETDFNKDIDSGDDPLLSCETYINLKLSSQPSQNLMMKPTTPRKSPRLSLGARDLTDEHFSPQKQRLSQSIEKERRESAKTPDKQKKRIPRLNLDLPVSVGEGSVFSPREGSVFSPTDNKENHITPLTPAEEPMEETRASHHTQSDIDTSAVIEKGADCSYVYELPTESPSASTSQSPKKALASTNSHIEKLPQPLCISTPAQVLHSKPSYSVVSSTPTSINIKKSLFNTQNKLPSDAQSPKPIKILNKKGLAKRQRSVHFEQKNSSVEYGDCFGFDENCSPVLTSPRSTTKSMSRRVSETPSQPRKSKIKSPYKHSPHDYERQSSLLSFGSASQYDFCDDDVFSAPPKMPDLPTPGPNYNNSTQGSSQLENSQSSTGNYDSLNRPKHYTVSTTSELAMKIRRRHKSSCSSDKCANNNKTPASEKGDWPDAVLSAPGFKVSASVRRVSRQRRSSLQSKPSPSPHNSPTAEPTHFQGGIVNRQSPRKSFRDSSPRKSVEVLSSKRSPRKPVDIIATRSSPRKTVLNTSVAVNSRGKRVFGSPDGNTPAKRLRAASHIELITPPVTPILNSGGDFMILSLPRARTPRVYKDRERLMLSQRDISVCSSTSRDASVCSSTAASDNETEATSINHSKRQSPRRHPSTHRAKKLSTPVKRNLMRSKYNYPVGRASTSAASVSPHRQSPRRVCSVQT